ncbi:MAG: oligosaccharide flippase family protein [Ignavibacteria bacterium]|nr:oligosaccharide flippase family protein [Ignavibacteria bacterium]
MKLSENIDKVVWSVLDKGLYVLYGFVSLLQIRRLDPSELGLYGILIGIHTWIFIIVDSLLLQSIIQFGFKTETEARANTFALLFTVVFVVFFSFSFSLLSELWVQIFKEPGISKVAFFLPWLSVLTIPRIYCLKFAFKHSNMLNLFLVNAAFFLPMSILTVYLYFTKPTFSFYTLMRIYFTGTLISSLTAVVLLKKYIRLGFNGNLNVKSFFSFGLPMMSYSLFQSIPRQLDVLFLQYFFQSKVVGIYYSAKTLFRLFEEGINAGFGLVYPTAVRLIAKGRNNDLRSLIVKSTSFTFLLLVFLFVLLELGGTEFFVKLLLPEKYLLSISFFNLMLIGTVFMPLQLSASVLIAENQAKKVAKYIFVSSIFSVIVFITVGLTRNISLAPLGLVSYYAVFGIILYFYMRDRYHFRFVELFQGIKDIVNFFVEKRQTK